jgi:hypothetical protein
MYILVCLAVGMFLGGWRALCHARVQKFGNASSALRRGVIAPALGTFVLLGWPWKSQSVEVSEEVGRTIMETVEVAVEVPSWIFFTTTRTETREVPRVVVETVVRSETRNSFSLWLLIPMGLLDQVRSGPNDERFSHRLRGTPYCLVYQKSTSKPPNPIFALISSHIQNLL